MMNLNKLSSLNKKENVNLIPLSKEITKLTHGISQNNTRITLNQRQIRELEHEIQTITSNLQNRNSEHEKLEQFRETLSKTIEDLSDRRQEIVYHDFAYSLLKDDGVKQRSLESIFHSLISKLIVIFR